MSQSQLVDRILVNKPEADKAVLNKAYIFGTKMHGRQLRASGDPYFSHPIEVAGILSDLKLDTTSVVCALLHDTIEDCPPTNFEEIASHFGKKIASIVVELTDDKSLPKQKRKDLQIANASKKSPEASIIKLADLDPSTAQIHENMKNVVSDGPPRGPR